MIAVKVNPRGPLVHRLLAVVIETHHHLLIGLVHDSSNVMLLKHHRVDLTADHARRV
jgi:hypothetical protein